MIENVASSERAALAAPELLMEYLTATGEEVGQSWVLGPDLPAVFQKELDELADFYGHPGAFFVAFRSALSRPKKGSPGAGAEVPIGCVGVCHLAHGVAALRRLWVRPGFRNNGVGRSLMDLCLTHARQVGIDRLVLDILPSRVRVIDWYKSLGFEEIEPFEEVPVPMVFLGRDM